MNKSICKDVYRGIYHINAIHRFYISKCKINLIPMAFVGEGVFLKALSIKNKPNEFM